MALILATPFVVGARYGLRAVRSGVGSGWIGFLLHLILAVIALVMPIVEAVA